MRWLAPGAAGLALLTSLGASAAPGDGGAAGRTHQVTIEGVQFHPGTLTVRRGDRIMRRYNRRLYRLARASLGQDAEAKDALQEAYLCAYRGLTQFRGESALATWLARIVLNECTARHRRTARRRNVVPMMSLDSH